MKINYALTYLNSSELEFVRIGICQKWNLSELEFVRIGICQNWNLPELEFVRIGICQNWNLPELEFVRIGICQNWKNVRIGICQNKDPARVRNSDFPGLSNLAISPVFSIFLFLCCKSKPLKVRGHAKLKPICPVKGEP